MAPPSLWSGNLRLSLVLIPVKLCPAVSTEEAVSFRMIHEPSGARGRAVLRQTHSEAVHRVSRPRERVDQAMSGRFEPEKMPDEYARAVHELVKAKVEHRATEVQIAPEGKPMAPVINIMDALKASMQKQGQAKVRDAVLDALRSHGVEVLEDGLRLVPKKRLR